jgi:hypothetical protein
MKISASYNFFNGDEHLIPSLILMRKCVEHISIIWQPISNSGEKMSSYAEEALALAGTSHLADDIILYEPDLTLEHVNERIKRRLGLNAARNVRASHFISVDADEFYRPEEFHAARCLIEENGWRSTSVNSFLHLKRPIYRSSDITCCCFVTAIDGSTDMGVADFPCPHVDPTRSMTADLHTHHHFDPSVVAMYHMNLVRRDLDQKLRNSTTRDTHFLSLVQDAVETWRPGQSFSFPNKGVLAIYEVPNEFHTYDPAL